MAAQGLHLASLLVLLVMSFPGSKAVASQHLCGANLVDALILVCGERGYMINPKRDLDSVLRFLPLKTGGAAPAGGDNDIPAFAYKDQMEMMMKRGVVEKCCLNPCTIFELEDFCV